MDTEAFDLFWKAYPKRKGPPNKSGARKSFQTRLKEGADAEKIIEAAKSYARKRDWHDPRHPDPDRLIPMAQTWLNQRRWEDYEDEQKPVVAPEKSDSLFEKYRQRRIREGWL